MIHLWAEAGWPVRCVVQGRVTPLLFRVSGIVRERDERVFVLGDDDTSALLPPELLSADCVEASTSAGGETRLRFHFPYCDILIDDHQAGGSDAIH